MPLTINVIDDDNDLRISLVEILDKAGFRTTGYTSAEDWFNRPSDSSPELILLDDLMPGIRGAQSIPAIRKKCPTTRIIMVTAFGSIDHAVNAMQAGADDYLVKPFRKEALLQLVQRHIEEQKFLRNAQKKGLGETLSAISNPIRRSILELLRTESSMRFMEITRALDIEDHTKVNFHLKNLRHSGLVDLNENRGYQLTAQGRQVLDALSLIGTE